MSTMADSIRRGLEQAVAYADGTADKQSYRVHVPPKIDVKAIRTGLGLTQEEFAGRFGFSVNTLRPRSTRHSLAMTRTCYCGCSPSGNDTRVTPATEKQRPLESIATTNDERK